MSFVEQTAAAGLIQGHAEAAVRGKTRTIPYGDVSQIASAGATRVRITPTKAALRLLRRGRLAKIVARVTFVPAGGRGNGRVQTLSFPVKRRR